ncbi:probable LRR receptor-like serine/threonine-protein kinase At1g05700 [Lathyrus oleraceus]|nr:probable LRR receptor-like serine/threonine-protein kinase At1g05700 [Pisum sativum]
MKQTMVGMLMHFLSLLLGVLPILVLIQAQDQSGFISIDCGLPEHSSYASTSTGINYISDAKFIDTGVTKIIPPPLGNTILQQLQYVRSFPSGVRNCYRINVTNGTKYLIRASFYYGNYDNLNEPPEFDIHFGPNAWDTVKFINLSRITSSEIIYTPSLDYIQPCLVNTGKGTPFISVIELRTLNNKAYVIYSPKSVLSVLFRYDMASITNLEYRYKDDVYDRVWFPFKWDAMKKLSTDEDVLNSDSFEPPSIVMSTAVTPFNASAPIQLFWDSDDVNDQYYFYMYFNEVEKLAENETREFNIMMNGELMYGPEIPPYRSVDPIISTSALTGAKRYTFSLEKTENSTLPPILNAMEFYKLIDFSLSETQQDDVDAITNIKKTYGVTRNWEGDPCGPVKYMWEGLNCTMNDGLDPPRITSLNLSSSGLTGQIASSISKLTMLQYLDLSNNSLNGSLPYFLVELRSLKVLNVRYNNFTGLIPSELLERSKTGSLSLSVDGDSNSDSDSIPPTKSGKNKNLSVPLTASFSALGVILLILLGFWIFRRHKVTSSNSKKEDSKNSKQQVFSYGDIINITENFKTIIGEGGFGKVYIGILQDQTHVAVKMLSRSSIQGYKEFQSEAQLLTIVHHKNLVSLIGYCDEGDMKALIYEYMANGNLQHLLGGNSNILKWNDRLNIAIDAAYGIDYMHNGIKPPIVHRDLKPSNILLDDKMHAKIADFGLSRVFFNDIDSHISTRPAGTFGYLDPECQRTGNISKRNDVYSFGIILFVLITGRQAIERVAGKSIHILEWVTHIIDRGDIKNIVDPRLEGKFNMNSAWKVVEIAMSCILEAANERPDISQILAGLNECLSMEMVQINKGRERGIVEFPSVNMGLQSSPLAR